jgi:hypothetical protein
MSINLHGGESQLSRLDHFDKIELCRHKAYSPQQLSLHIHVKIA